MKRTPPPRLSMVFEVIENTLSFLVIAPGCRIGPPRRRPRLRHLSHHPLPKLRPLRKLDRVLLDPRFFKTSWCAYNVVCLSFCGLSSFNLLFLEDLPELQHGEASRLRSGGHNGQSAGLQSCFPCRRRYTQIPTPTHPAAHMRFLIVLFC